MACPTSSSDLPKPYAGAVSISVMPRSSAVRIVLTASASSLPPHIQPPIDHVPRPIRELIMALSALTFCSIIVVTSLRCPSDARGTSRVAAETRATSRPSEARRRETMETTRARNDNGARSLLKAQLDDVAVRLRREAEVPPTTFVGGNFLDVAQGVEQQ